MSEIELKKELEGLNEIRYTLPQEVKDQIEWKLGTYGKWNEELIDMFAIMFPQHEVRKILEAHVRAKVIEDELYELECSRKKRDKEALIDFCRTKIRLHQENIEYFANYWKEHKVEVGPDTYKGDENEIVTFTAIIDMLEKVDE